MQQARLHLLDQDNRNYYRTIYRLELLTNLALSKNEFLESFFVKKFKETDSGNPILLKKKL